MKDFLLVEFITGKSLAIIKKEDYIRKLAWNEDKFYEVKVLETNDNWDVLDKVKQELLKPKLKTALLESDSNSTGISIAKKSYLNARKSNSNESSLDCHASMNSKKRFKIDDNGVDGSIEEFDVNQKVEIQQTMKEASKTMSIYKDTRKSETPNDYVSWDAENANLNDAAETQIRNLQEENSALKLELKTAQERMETLLTCAMNLVQKLQVLHNSSTASSNIESLVPSMPVRNAPLAKLKCHAENAVLEADGNFNEREYDSDSYGQLKWKRTDKDVVKLVSNREIYIPNLCLQNILKVSRSSTQMARNLVKAIFTDNALSTCSVYGGVSKGLQGKTNEIRMPLHQEAINTIIDYSLEKGLKAKWPDKKKHIVHSLGSLLSTARKQLAPSSV